MTTTLTPLWIAVLGIGYVTFESVTMVVPPEVEVRRTLSTDNPLPGDLVEVTLEVKNVGNRTLPDVRVVDGVPDPLPVVEGTPSLHTGLVPDGTDEVTYVVRAKRGEFEFDGTRVVTRSLSGSREYATDLGLASRITCRTLLDDISLSDQTLRRIGVVRGDEGGGGIEFYATREYQEGDPMNRIDWNRLAKTNELTTIQFRERRAASVVLVVDERTVARVAPARTELDGVDLSVYAAERVFLRLLEEGNRVGLMSVADEVDAIAPRKGDTQRVRVQSQLRSATDRYAATLGEDEIDVDPPALGRRTSRETPLGRIERRLPEDAQVLLLSPVTDSFALEAAERLQARGHLVTVMTPDSVGSATHGERVRRLERLCRLRAIRETGARVVDWEPDEPIQSAVVRAAAYWT